MKKETKKKDKIEAREGMFRAGHYRKVNRTATSDHPGHQISLGNLNFYRPLGPMTIQAAENCPLLAEDDLLPAAVAYRHLALGQSSRTCSLDAHI